MRPTSQAARLLAWLHANPGASSIEITFALRVVNVTGRISDLRKAGFDIVCIRDEDGVDRYRVVEPAPPAEPVALAMFWSEAS